MSRGAFGEMLTHKYIFHVSPRPRPQQWSSVGTRKTRVLTLLPFNLICPFTKTIIERDPSSTTPTKKKKEEKESPDLLISVVQIFPPWAISSYWWFNNSSQNSWLFNIQFSMDSCEPVQASPACHPPRESCLTPATEKKSVPNTGKAVKMKGAPGFRGCERCPPRASLGSVTILFV